MFVGNVKKRGILRRSVWSAVKVMPLPVLIRFIPKSNMESPLSQAGVDDAQTTIMSMFAA